uniref:Dynein heavy chain tail domain-containing protein n=1 Tax=Periophthalmus magnuspinnatus TaxID=409849 RepID=A0A3B4AB83_9GOBI
MSDEESVPCFLEDVRVKFVQGVVCRLLRLQRQTWEKSAASQEFQTLLQQFFDKNSVIFIFVSKNGGLEASNELCAPLLANTNNHKMWPRLLSQDVIHHVERISSKTAVVQGQIQGKTVLPIPMSTQWLDKPLSHVRIYDRSLTHTIETHIINWTNQIHKTLMEDSADIMKTGSNPGPWAELKFWASRKSNIESIYQQLQSPVVQKMEKALETIESSYHPVIQMGIEKVFKEAEDIDLHLQPLHTQLSYLETNGFAQIKQCIPSLFHTILLIWTNCRSYQRPARIVVLLQQLCNLLIDQAGTYLSEDVLLREDTKESLQMVQRALDIFLSFKKNYETQREHLVGSRSHAPWDFPSAMVFTRFNKFFNRMQQIEDTLEIMLDFERMEKLEFGGVKGKLYNDQAAQLYAQFSNQCQIIRHTENNPLDCDSKDFESDYSTFKDGIVDFECRLASFLCSAFKDCSGLDSPFMERKLIREIFSHNFLILKQLLREELDICRVLLKQQFNQVFCQLNY